MSSMKRQKDIPPENESPMSVGVQCATREEQRESSRRKKRLGQSRNDTQLWMCLVVKRESDAVKTMSHRNFWNVRSMNQGKLDMVKQEMAKVNIDILGISELQWTGMGKFNSEPLISYCAQESLRRNGIALTVNRRVQNTVLGGNTKNDKMISVCFQCTAFI